MSLLNVLSQVPDWLVAPVEELLRMVLSSHDPVEAIERAKVQLATEAADAATDAALDEALK